ncbi:MAG: hypothetical protein DMF26_18170 [Verrucomicrobia bacterium]|nr:MAG: hypothetical protein DMF26_18170 [Verrucomicrobiota bacterium]
MVKPHERRRLHIDALLLDPFYGDQGKFLKIFGNGEPRIARMARIGECTRLACTLQRARRNNFFIP